MKILDSIRNNKWLQMPIIKSLIVNLLLMAAFFITMHPYLENEADVIMQDLIYGNYAAGVPTDAILFSNYILAKIIIGLRSAIPTVHWYMVFQWICCLAALVVVGGLTFRRCGDYAGRWIAIGVLAYLGFECYVTPGYIKTSAILAIACAYLLLEIVLLWHELQLKNRIIYMGTAVVLGVLSSFMSFFLFAVIFVVCALLSAVYLIIMRPYNDRKQALKSIGVGVALALFILIMGAGLYYMDRLHYFRSPELSASIAYRLGYEKSLSYGVPYFRFRNEELAAAHEAVYRLGALDPGQVDTNERLLYMGEVRLHPTIYEVANFFRFEPEHISHLPMIYLWFFLAYMLFRYGGRRGRISVGVSFVLGIATLFTMRQFLLLGYYRMYTIEIMPFIYFFMLWLGEVNYEPDVEVSDGKRRAMLAVDVILAVYLAFFLFGDDFPTSKDMVHETEILYVEDDATSQEEETEQEQPASSIVLERLFG